MTDYNTIHTLFEKNSFTEIRGDDRKELIQVHDAVTVLLENYSLIPKGESLYEYGYVKSLGAAQVIAVIGDEKAFEEYKLDVESSPRALVRKYFKRPKDARVWEELPDQNQF